MEQTSVFLLKSQPVVISGLDLNKGIVFLHLPEQCYKSVTQTSSADPGKALSINMSNSQIDVLNLIEKLRNILMILDKNDHPIAAIKVEEAINVLEQAADQQGETENNV
ncbi:MAG: hypothetical protein ABJP02_10135 [Parasphingorhabdus sp.]|uniref:hypothetical protein n=1 Tax=Parasphingorhabdus sp. TaxID=2709688 RepID=UPI00326510F4